MGLFNLLKDKTPPPLYMHGNLNSPNHFLSPIPPPKCRQRRSHNANISEKQRYLVPCCNPRDPNGMQELGGLEHTPEGDGYGGSQRGLGGLQDVLSDNAYARSLLGEGSARSGIVRRGVVGGLARAQAHRRAAMYHEESRAGSVQRPNFAAERDPGYGAGFSGSDGMESRGYARSLGNRSTGRSRGRLEPGDAGEDTIAEEEGRSVVGVFGAENPRYHASRGRRMFAGGWMGAAGRRAMHERGPFD